MICFVYYLFFIFLNLSLFLFLSKKILLNRSLNLIIAILFAVIYSIHQLNIFEGQMNPFYFRKISVFSIFLIFWFYLNNYFLKDLEPKKQSLNYFNKCIFNFVKRGFLIHLLFITTTIIELMMVSDFYGN
jgi:hypothetical protein